MIQGWITFDDRKVMMEEMTHQHMSNILHFMTIVNPGFYSNSVRMDILKWLNIRFKGEILPYHPVPEFTEEKNYLKRMGYLRENNDIVYNHQVIGSYE